MQLARLIIVLIIVGFCLPLAAGATIQPLFSDNFDSDTTGLMPNGWSTLTSLKTSAYYAKVIDTGEPAGNKAVDIYEQNLAPEALSLCLWRQAATDVTSGLFTVQFDIKLQQTTAGCLARVNGNYSGTAANNGRSWIAAINFEGNVPCAPGGGSGKISYQTQSFSQVYVLNPAGATYTANTWYTVKIRCDVSSAVYHIYFGPRGSRLAEITPACGVPFIKNGGIGGGAPREHHPQRC